MNLEILARYAPLYVDAAILAAARPGDQVLVMSNGGFGGIHGRLLAGLGSREGNGK